MTDDEICKHMDWVPGFIAHPVLDDFAARVRALVRAAEAAEREACAAVLDEVHEKRKHLDNHAAYYARMIRERGAI